MTYRIFSFIIALTALSCAAPKSEQTEATLSVIDNAELIDTIQGDIDGNGTADNVSLYHNIERDSSRVISEDYLLIINRADSTIFRSTDRLSNLTLESESGSTNEEEEARSRLRDVAAGRIATTNSLPRTPLIGSGIETSTSREVDGSITCITKGEG
jgi:hypothetical protein